MKFFLLNSEYKNPQRFVIVMLLALPLLFANGCSTDSGSEEEPIPLEILLATNTRYVDEESQDIRHCVFKDTDFGSFSQADSSELNGVLRSKSIVIDTQEDFDTYISCGDSVSVNMETDFLLGGFAGTPGCHVLWEQNVELLNDSLYYNIEIMNELCASPEASSFLVSIPREYSEYLVKFNVHWWEEES